MNQLAELPDIDKAELPVKYVAAQTALAECTKIDECKDWADKARALASYAKQADDESMRKMATRIQARAIRRCGALLKEIEPSKGGDPSLFNAQGGTPPSVTRKSAAEEAGLSDDQRKNAIRVANVPEDQFNELVESDDPPTVTELAEMGQRRSVIDLGDSLHEQFVAASQVIGVLTSANELLWKYQPYEVAPGMNEAEKVKMRKVIDGIRNWIDRFNLQIS